MKSPVLVFLLLITMSTRNIIEATNFICYYTSLTAAYPGYGDNGNFTVANIDPQLCSHYIYNFAVVDALTKKIDSWDAENDFNSSTNGFLGFTALKSQNNKAKFLLALQIINNQPGMDMSSPSSIQALVNSTIDILTRYKFDGLSLDWNTPTSQANFTSYSSLVVALKTAFRPLGLILTSYVSVNQSTIDGYDVSIMNANLDQVYLPTYDYHRPSKEPTVARHHTPLYTPANDSGMASFTTHYSINYWLSKGLSRKLIHLGIAPHAVTWALNSSNPVTSFSPPLAAVTGGSSYYSFFTKGFLSRSDIYYVLNSKNVTVYQDSTNSSGPWGANPNFWMGYDDEAMARTKAIYVLQNNLGGAMLYDIAQDDFKNLWGFGKNPFTTAISSVLKSSFYFTTTTSSTTQKIPTSTPAKVERKSEILSYNAVKYDWKVSY